MNAQITSLEARRKDHGTGTRALLRHFASCNHTAQLGSHAALPPCRSPPHPRRVCWTFLATHRFRLAINHCQEKLSPHTMLPRRGRDQNGTRSFPLHSSRGRSIALSKRGDSLPEETARSKEDIDSFRQSDEGETDPENGEESESEEGGDISFLPKLPGIPLSSAPETAQAREKVLGLARETAAAQATGPQK